MDPITTIGQLLGSEAQRDAVHFAIAPVVAAHVLAPGDGVEIVNGEARPASPAKRIGVLDPFLSAPVRSGQRFWLFLNPGSITSLRHEWAHPAFGPVGKYDGISASERWIREWCDRCLPISYEVVMEGADTWVHTAGSSKWGGDYLTLGGLLEGEYVPDEFWPHYETVRGVAVPDEHKQSFFSCSC